MAVARARPHRYRPLSAGASRTGWLVVCHRGVLAELLGELATGEVVAVYSRGAELIRAAEQRPDRSLGRKLGACSFVMGLAAGGLSGAVACLKAPHIPAIEDKSLRGAAALRTCDSRVTTCLLRRCILDQQELDPAALALRLRHRDRRVRKRAARDSQAWIAVFSLVTGGLPAVAATWDAAYDGGPVPPEDEIKVELLRMAAFGAADERSQSNKR